MKLTKTKLNQLIREALAESWDVGPPPDQDAPGWHPNMSQEWERDARASERWEEEGDDLLASLSKEEKELAEDILGWWARQIDETGRLSGHTGKDGSVQRRLWSDEILTNPPPGFRLTEKHLEFVFEALEGWIAFGDAKDDSSLTLDWKNKGGDELIKKIKAILADDEPEEREPEQAKRCLNDTDCTEDEMCYKGQCQPQQTHGRFGTLEFYEALQRYKEGQVMKLTRSKLHQLIHEELERKIANEPIPVKDFEWGGKELKLSSAEGRDSWSPIRTKKAFYAWKATVLSHGKGSEVVLDTHLKRWVPAAGPWKEKSDAYSAGKAQDMAIHGSH